MRDAPIKRALTVPLLILLCGSAVPVFAGPPDWFQRDAHEPLPNYPDNAAAVMLRNEQIVSIKSTGEITTVYRRVYRVLRPEGNRYSEVQIYFDSETKVTALKAWSIPTHGNSYELGEKDSADTIPFTDNLYEDTRRKVLKIPAAGVGAVIGYEYEQRRRPSILQYEWLFQLEIPVRQARLQVNLPSGWEHREVWANRSPVPLKPGPRNQLVWEISDIPAIALDRSMPPMLAIAGQLLLTYSPPDGTGSSRSWSDLGTWYTSLVADRRQSSPELRQKVKELTEDVTAVSSKIQTLATFVQKEIRYVAIEIGIGGYQPHAAAEVFRNRYGDCKDKVTLLSTMLREIGVESYYVLINTDRSVVHPEFASPLRFNHAIAAIRLPEDPGNSDLQGFVRHARLGPLLFFDPTSPYVTYGDLPAELQDNQGALVSDAGGELLKLPSAPPSSNLLERRLQLQLQTDGSVSGWAQETRKGAQAADFRGAWQNTIQASRLKILQSQFSRRLLLVEVNNLATTGIDGSEYPQLTYQLRVPAYAKPAGSLLLLRPALTEWSDDILEHSERSQPLVFPSTIRQVEVMEIAIPETYTVDELPAPVTADIGIASYMSKVEFEGRVLRLTRQLEINSLLVDTKRQADLKELYRTISTAEGAAVLLKRR